jgi:hypothetical protein
MNKLILALSSFLIIGCAHCSSQEQPYIRTQPGIEYCQKMCDKFKELNCIGYYEDLDIDCKKDKIYSGWDKCKSVLSEIDASTIVPMTCTEFCEYELKNSIPLNPQCVSNTLKDCSEIETICQ